MFIIINVVCTIYVYVWPKITRCHIMPNSLGHVLVLSVCVYSPLLTFHCHLPCLWLTSPVLIDNTCFQSSPVYLALVFQFIIASLSLYLVLCPVSSSSNPVNPFCEDSELCFWVHHLSTLQYKLASNGNLLRRLVLEQSSLNGLEDHKLHPCAFLSRKLSSAEAWRGHLRAAGCQGRSGKMAAFPGESREHFPGLCLRSTTLGR